MKHFNLIKITSLLLIVSMMFGSVTTFAQLSAITPDQATNKITITGTIAASDTDIAKGVHLSIHGPDATDAEIDSGVKLIDTDMVLVNAGEAYTISFTMPETAEPGIYKVVEGGAAETTVLSFYFASIGTKESALTLIKAAATANDEGEMRALLDQYANDIQIGDLYNDLSESAKDKVAKEMAEDTALKNMSTDISAMSVVNKAGVQACLPQALNEKKVVNTEQFSNYLDALDDTMFSNLFRTGMAAAAQQAVTDRLSNKNLADITALKTMFKEQTFLVALGYADGVVGANKVLNEYGSFFSELTNLTSWKGATDFKKSEIAKNIISTKPDTLSALNTYLYVAPVNPGNPSNPSNPSNHTNGSTIIISGTPTPTPTSIPTAEPSAYSDIASVGWASEAIGALTKLGVFNGYPDGSFRPNNPITREEFIKAMTVCVYGTDVTDTGSNPTFIDAQDGWYSPFIDIAERRGITNGAGDNRFGIGSIITRQEVAAMIYRMAVAENYNVNSNDVNFTDAADIADYARPCVNALANAEIITGYDDGSFLPLGNTTRAEAAVLLYKACKAIGKIL